MNRNKMYILPILLILFFVIGCVRNQDERVYEVIYTNGDRERITHVGRLNYMSEGYRMCEVDNGCVHYMSKNAHGRSLQICGVRNIQLISYKKHN